MSCFFFVFLFKKLNNQKNGKFFFLYGWLFGLSYFLSNLYWITISLTFDPNFKSFPLTFFEPMVKKIFSREPYSQN